MSYYVKFRGYVYEDGQATLLTDVATILVAWGNTAKLGDADVTIGSVSTAESVGTNTNRKLIFTSTITDSNYEFSRYEFSIFDRREELLGTGSSSTNPSASRFSQGLDISEYLEEEEPTSSSHAIIAEVRLYVNSLAPVTKTVTLDPNGGTVTPTTIECTTGSTYGTLPTPTWSGYTFDGWFSAATGGTEITSETPFTESSPTTLYAQWTEIPVGTYAIQYDANGGTGAPETQTVTQGESVTLSTTKPTRTGYTFVNWLDEDTSTEYDGGETITPTGNMTLVAQWSGGSRKHTGLVMFIGSSDSVCYVSSGEIGYD